MVAKVKKKVKKKGKPSGPEIFCSYTKLELLDKLKPNPANPNKHPDRQVDLLVKLITTHGWRHPITVSNGSGVSNRPSYHPKRVVGQEVEVLQGGVRL